MCGIMGYVGRESASDVLIAGLKRLEYRGYDSSGIALLDKDLFIRKKPGKLMELEACLKRR
jgi:glucosamine--fructose-6-phosphate aminotransferase (isomerizing)